MDDANVNVWTEICTTGPEPEPESESTLIPEPESTPLIDLLSLVADEEDDAKSVLVPARVEKRDAERAAASEPAEDVSAEDVTAEDGSASPEVVEDQLESRDGSLEEFADLFLGAEDTVIGTNLVGGSLEDVYEKTVDPDLEGISKTRVNPEDVLLTTVGPDDDALYVEMCPNGRTDGNTVDIDVNNNAYVIEIDVVKDDRYEKTETEGIDSDFSSE